MNRSTTHFIAFIAIALYISTIAFFSIKIISYSREGREAVITQCTELTQNTFDLLEHFNRIQEPFIQAITQLYDKSPTIAAVLLEDNIDFFYSYPKNSSLLSIDSYNAITVKSNSPFISVFSTTLLFDGTPFSLTLALYHISPNLIHDVAKKCFFILFATTLFVLLTLTINKILLKENKTKYDEHDYTKTPENTFETDFLFDDDFNLDNLEYEQPIDEYSSENAIPLDTSNFEQDLSLDVPFEKNIGESKEEQPIKETKLVNKKIMYQGKTISDPLGLFSPKTGLGWESYLETRLDSELIRASSSEQDLSLVCVKIQGIEHYPAYIEFVTKVLLDIFKFRDLLFEYGDEGFACIYQDLNVEKSLELAEDLYIALKKIFENCDVKIAIGISTRALRIIPGTRILQEAQQALEKALSDEENPIIAFKANPDKYKDFVYDNL